MNDPFAPIERPSAVLFACTMNSIRSPMGEGLLKKWLGTSIYVDSCGVRPGELDPFIVEVMGELDIDISHHRPKSFDELQDGFFDLIVSLSPEAQHRAIEMTRVMACDIEYWPLLDASIIEGTREVRLQAYRAVRDQLFEKIKRRFPID